MKESEAKKKKHHEYGNRRKYFYIFNSREIIVCNNGIEE